jgi:ketosteroid isomerase-like protein
MFRPELIRIFMRNYILLFIGFFLAAGFCSAQTKAAGEKGKIISLLFAQRDAWNKGDLEGYMNGYWKSDSLKFIGSRGITYGWKNTLENYRKGYPDKTAMGQLEFSSLQVDVNGSSAFVIGRWKLTRTKDTPQGYFTLLCKKIKNKWCVVVDHSS